MPKPRPSLRGRLEAERAEPRGREAVYGPPSPSSVDRGPSTVGAGRSWEEAHHRVTFYCPRDLLAELEAEMERSGRSKSRVIVDALVEHL